MANRREFITAAGTLPFLTSFVANNRAHSSSALRKEVPGLSDWLMPEEGDPHECTWMSFGASRSIWGRKLLGEVCRNLALVARTIARFEPVVMCVRPDELDIAKEHFEDDDNIEFFECDLNDLWIRDYGSVFVLNSQGERGAINFNFNGWGEKQEFEADGKVAASMAAHMDSLPVQSELCLEGGGIEVDGEGTAIITESCVLNRNRNPGWTKKKCEDELFEMLGLEKIIWLPGVKDADITDGHTDFYARFTSPGVVVAHVDNDRASSEHELTRRHLEILESATDRHDRKLEVVSVPSPSFVRRRFDNEDFCAGYINFYVCNGAVIAPEFGDARADRHAKEVLTDLFPKREIVMLNIDGIAAGGGGIHCATQQVPKT